MKRCIVGIRRPDGSLPQGLEAPAIWFPSLASLAAVLSDEHRRLLRLIHDIQPKSLTELAKFSGRKVSNLSRTLRMMSNYGLVSLQHMFGRFGRPPWRPNFWSCWIEDLSNSSTDHFMAMRSHQQLPQIKNVEHR